MDQIYNLTSKLVYAINSISTNLSIKFSLKEYRENFDKLVNFNKNNAQNSQIATKKVMNKNLALMYYFSFLFFQFLTVPMSNYLFYEKKS